jgi:SAM-dependent methyltransferase
MQTCPLCNNSEVKETVKGQDKRFFFHCSNCDLIFVAPQFLPDSNSEKSRYLHHQNNMEDKSYVDFLMQAINPVLPFLKTEMSGLDYGCGSTAVLSKILYQKGINCDNYDPYFYPEFPENKIFDFIFCTETIEHFFYPAKEFKKLNTLLKSKSLLILMTDFRQEINDFSNWYYNRDVTHVSFYNSNTFLFLANMLDAKIIYNDNKRVVILQKN